MAIQLQDLRLFSQQRTDRVGDTSITNAEWNGWINLSVAKLYGALTSTFADYNIKPFTFTLVGGTGFNTLSLGFGSQVPDFDKLRRIRKQVSNIDTNNVQWATVPKANSLEEMSLYNAPIVNPIYGNDIVHYALYGTMLEFVPVQSAGGTFEMLYIPAMPLLVNDTDTIDGFWLGTNGWHEFVILETSIKALLKQEKLEAAQVMMMQSGQEMARILKEASFRDDNRPGTIADVKRVNANYGVGSWGPGWGGNW